MKRVIRTTVSTLAILSFVIMGSGCATARLSTSKQVASPPSQVSIMISDKTAQHMTQEQVDAFKVLIIDRLQRGQINAVSAANKAVVSIAGEITVYDPGSRALRYFMGLGAGKGTLKSSWCLKGEDGSVLGSCEINGDIKAGTFGGSFTEVIDKTGGQLVRFLKGAIQ